MRDLEGDVLRCESEGDGVIVLHLPERGAEDLVPLLDSLPGPGFSERLENVHECFEFNYWEYKIGGDHRDY